MDNLELVNKKVDCCGCGHCSIKCPKNAIEMKEDEYGYVYPYIHKDICINCGVCKRVCQYNKQRKKCDFDKSAYVAVSKDEQILTTTASGGVFTSIAKSFIEKGGIVYGCALLNEKEKFIVKHIKLETIDELEKIKGSKYVQSDITSVYEEIKEELKKGNKVLFSGTPCQVAAIKEYTNDDNLFTIDIICHGVPNNKMLNDYINYIENKEKIRIKDFKFRDKSKGWGLNYSYTYKDSDNHKYKKKVKPSFESSYYQLFLDSYTYRDNCYSCKYANENRVGDMTIGDYWGIEIEHKELINKNIYPKKGVSCVILNSPKGELMFEKYTNDVNSYESKFEKIKIHNHQLNNPSFKPKDRQELLEVYKNYGFSAVEKFYDRKNFIKNSIKRVLYKLK